METAMMRRSLLAATLLSGAALLLPAGAARADDSPFYVGAGISRAKLSQITDSGLRFSDISRTSWKVLAGIRPISPFAVEADYTDLGSQSTTFFAQRSAHSDAKAFAAYAAGFLPVPMPFLDLYGKIGVSRWKLNGSSEGPTSSLFSFSRSGTGFAWGAGAQVHVGNVGARLEYESFNIPNTNGAQLISLDVILRL
jgi:opacity protein-like surface antigen